MFTVSAQDYLSLLEGKKTVIFTEKEQTGIPELQRHINYTNDEHNKAKVKEYVDTFIFLTFLAYQSLASEPCSIVICPFVP